MAGSALRAEVVAIGDELTHGQSTDRNSGEIARELEPLGVELARFTVVGDDPDELRDALALACARSALVVTTGGIGPTEDDRTREAAAAVAGVELEWREECWVRIQEWFRGRGREANESNKRQAWLPAGATVLENRWGTAPGVRMTVGGSCELFVLPGVPAEMRRMVAAYVAPWLREQGDLRPLAFHMMQVVGPGESDLGQRIAPYLLPGREPLVGITAHRGLLKIRIAARGDDEQEARAAALATAAELRPLLGDELVAEGETPLADQLAGVLMAEEIPFALAESCTGGLLAAAFTEVPGISDVFRGGFVCYSNAQKTAAVGVPPELLASEGAVSEPVAAALALGAAERTGARLGVGITGIAGPGGGTEDKPVGTVCFGLALDGQVERWTARFRPLGRSFVRQCAVLEVLAAGLKRLKPL